jgi:iron complex outermembrane receptor protein
VSLVGRSGSVFTSSDGEFRLDPEPTPPFQIVVFDRAGALLGTITVSATSETDWRRLVLPVGRIESVQVVSGVAPNTLSTPAGAATVTTRDDAQRVQPARLVDLMEQIPGASHASSGQAAVPSLRGLAGGRTLMLIDDARVTTERRAGPSATYLDPFGLERTEVVRGPGSVAYGSDALGGVIHARTPVPETEEFFGRFEIGAGTGFDFTSGAVEANIPARSAAFLIQAHQRWFGDYDSPDGPVPNSGARDRGFLVRGLAQPGSGKLVAGLQVDHGRDVGRPAIDSNRRLTSYPEENSERLTVAYDHPGRGGFSAFELRGFLGRYQLITERNTFPTEDSAGRIERSDVVGSDASLRFLASRPFERGLLRFGADVVSRFDLNANDSLQEYASGAGPVLVRDEETIESASRLDGGLFAELEYELAEGRWIFFGGLRGDRVRTRNEGGFFGDVSTAESALSGHAAVRWHFSTGWDASLQLARGFRDPRLSDRYFAGTTGRGQILGNPELDSETSRQLDAAIRGQAGPWSFATYGYFYRIAELIERFEVADRLFTFRNRGEEEIVGWEIETSYNVSKEFAVQGGFGWARGRIVDDGSFPDNIPAPNVFAAVRYRPLDRLWCQFGAAYHTRDDRPGPTEKITPSYALLNASVGWRFIEPLELRVNLKNLTDESYPAGQDELAPLAPGRNLAVVLNGRF